MYFIQKNLLSLIVADQVATHSCSFPLKSICVVNHLGYSVSLPYLTLDYLHNVIEYTSDLILFVAAYISWTCS